MTSLAIRTTGLEDYLEGGQGKLKLLLGGAPGAGKTRFASFAPKPIYADTEDGLMSVADRRVPYASIKSVTDMNAFLDLLDAEAKKPAAQQRFKTVIIDTLDAYQRIVTNDYLRKMRKEAMSGWEDWGYLDARMTNLLARLFLLPMNVIALMHVKDTKVNEVDVTQPKLKGDMRDQISADFDFVGLLQTRFGPVESAKGGVERAIIREIKWEPTPMAQWLKCRGGALTTTSVSFAAADWSAIQDGIEAQLAALSAGTMMERVQTAPEAEPVPVAAGGPVAGRGAASVATRATAAKPEKAAKVPLAKVATPPPPAKVTPPPPAKPPVIPAPVPDTAPTMEEAVATVEATLGGTVIADQVEDQVEQEPVVTPVAEQIPPSEPTPVEPTGEVPTNGTVTVACGSARFPGGSPKNASAGCGEPLTITLLDQKITAAEEGQDPGLLEIAGLRERAFLHNACYGKARAAAAAGK